MNAIKEHAIGLKHNIVTLILLSFAGSIIYGLPYFRTYYYDAYQQMYHLTNTQIGALGSAYGLLGVFSYAIGGILADKFGAKKLMIFSLTATGLGGFLHLFITDFHMLVAIYLLWGVTSLLTFWPALMKITRMQGTEDEQSRVYGIFEGGRGVFGAAHLAVATAIFGFFQVKAMPALGIRWIIVFYSVAPLILAVIFAFLIKEPKAGAAQDAAAQASAAEVSANTGTAKADDAEESARESGLTLHSALTLLRMPALWLIILMVFTTYSIRMSIFYFAPFSSNIVGTTAVVAAMVSAWQQYIRPFAAPGGGFLADRIGRGNAMTGGYILMGVGTALLFLVLRMSGTAQMVMLVFACSIVYFGVFSNYGLLYSFLTEGGVPLGVYGFAVGVVSTVGYLPEVLCPLLAGVTLDKYAGSTGYFIYFGFMIAMTVIGLALSILWTNTFGKRYKRQEAERKARESKARQSRQSAAKSDTVLVASVSSKPAVSEA
ncbi:Major Facilitator Superfamily [Bifidobacterium margollesii]|uniref:Major Facilitator Superfamily n=1 Tax=Bifidobacterium margollesii TaxID=2020964 RepID=A0A2N5JBY4_9BIFI|nr:MFS transporter [Bifidobacterium margollesii]PLS31732.1 Major Facilitator Superfamily [Bifidobacterium margollesii]